MDLCEALKMRIVYLVMSLVITCEIAALGYFYLLRQAHAPRPAVRMDALEPAAVTEIRDFESALDFSDPVAWFELAEVYRAFGLLQSADYCYREYQNRSPLSPDYLYYWGICLSQKGDLQDSSSKLTQAIKYGSRHAIDCFYMLGRNALRAENPGAAYPALLRASGDVEMSAVMLTRLLMRTGRIEDAMKLIDGVLRDEPTHMIANQFKSWAEAQLGNHTTAAHHEHMTRRCAQPERHSRPGAIEYERTIQRFDSARLCAAGVKAAKAQDYDTAVAWLRQAIDANWRDMYAVLLAQYEVATGDANGVAMTLRDSIDRVGATAEKLEMLGDVTVGMGHADAARDMWLRASALPASQNPGSSITIHKKLAAAFRHEGDTVKAKRYEGLAHYHKGKLAWSSSDVSTALAEFEKAARALVSMRTHGTTWARHAELRTTWMVRAGGIGIASKLTGITVARFVVWQRLPKDNKC